MDALFTAVDITGLSTNVVTILTGFIAIGLIFTGYRFIKRSGIR